MTRVRLERAKDLLRNSTLPVAAVAERAGYREAKHFIVIFRRATGLTPTDLRVAPPGAEVPGDDARLYPVNQHVLPLSVPDDHFSQFQPRPE